MQFVAEAFQRRTAAIHHQHCASLHKSNHDHFATTYGIHFNSILNESHYFHDTNGMVPDVMHDVLEGVAPYEVKEMIKFYTSNGFFTLTELNNRIESLSYPLSDSTVNLQ